MSRSNAMPGEYGPTGRGRRSVRTGECEDIVASALFVSFPASPARSARPFAPGTGVQLGARQPRVLEGEQIVTRRHARSAIAHDAIGGMVADRPANLRAQLFRRSKRAAVVEVR